MFILGRPKDISPSVCVNMIAVHSSQNIHIMLEEASISSKYILCGRGRFRYNCEGNKVFRQLVATNLASYVHFATRSKKSSLIKRVIEDLQNLGLTFVAMSQDGTTYEELTPQETRKKVAHRFRDALKKAKSLEHHEEKNSSSIEVSSLQYQQEMKAERFMLMPESFDCKDMQRSTQTTQAVVENFHSPKDHELQPIGETEDVFQPKSIKNIISQKSLITATHLTLDQQNPLNPFYFPSVDNDENIPVEYETFMQQELLVHNIFDKDLLLSIFDLNEDFDDWS
jgi:hypothetical protein